MAEVIYRFDNTPWGGNHNVTLAIGEMPDFYPITSRSKVNEMRGDRGKIWSYTWYRKSVYNFRFDLVSTTILATMGSLVTDAVNIRWYKDLDNSGGTGTMFFVGDWPVYDQIAPNLVSFNFPVEDLE